MSCQRGSKPSRTTVTVYIQELPDAEAEIALWTSWWLMMMHLGK